MKKIMGISATLFFLLVVTSCGGVSAPPVSLPSPVTGRIVVSSPDASGNISVTGEDGSVSGGSTVMVVNTTTSSFNWPEKFLNILVSDAYAANTFPSICSETGHACALADANGAFEVSIPGSIGDGIAVVLIDATTGEELSDRLTRTVPDDLTPLSGGPVSLALDSVAGQLAILLQGDSTNINKLQIADLSPWSLNSTLVDVGGAGGKQLAVGPVRAIATNIDSTNGANSLYIADITSDLNLLAFTNFSLSNITPADMLLALFDVGGQSTNYIVLANDTSTPSLFLLPNDGAMDPTDQFTVDFGQGIEHQGTEVVAAGTVSGDASPIPLIAIVSRSRLTNGTGEADTNIILYRRSAIETLLSSGLLPLFDDTVKLPAGAVVGDVQIIDGHVIVTDRSNDAIYIYTLTFSGNAIQFDLNPVVITSTEIVAPEKINVIQDVSGFLAIIFITLENGTDTRTDTVLTLIPDAFPILTDTTFQQKITEVGLGPTDLVYDFANNFLYVSCFKSKNIARLPIADLLP